MSKPLLYVAYAEESTSRLDVNDAFRCASDVLAVLLKNNFNAKLLPITKKYFIDNESFKKIKQDDCKVYNFFEGFSDQSYAEIIFIENLEKNGVPFTGNGSLALKQCLNKSVAKQILKNVGLAVPRGVFYKYEDHTLDLRDITLSIDFPPPYFIKPVQEDASLGIDASSLVHTKGELQSILRMKSLQFPEGVLVEEFLEGTEYCASFVMTRERPGTMRFSNVGLSKIDYRAIHSNLPFISYESKWDESSTDFRAILPDVSPKIETKMKEKIVQLAQKSGEALSCSGYFRVDMRTRLDGEICVIDVNPNPDINNDSGFMRMAHAAGLGYEEMVLKLLGEI